MQGGEHCAAGRVVWDEMSVQGAREWRAAGNKQGSKEQGCSKGGQLSGRGAPREPLVILLASSGAARRLGLLVEPGRGQVEQSEESPCYGHAERPS